MIQLNLLPDVKQQYINAQKQRRMFTSVSVLVMGVAVIILVLLFGYNLALKKHLHDLNKDIADSSQELKSKPNINNILTVQNQLGSLPSLDASKPAASRLFTTYLNELTPSSVAISDFSIDFSGRTITITGTSSSLSNVNQYIDTLKKTTFTTTAYSAKAPAFSNIVLSTFGINTQTSSPSQAASYTITLAYNPTIFNIAESAVTLNVPSITTRADVNSPTDLFQAGPTTAKSTSPGGQ
jgi:Tfp pilus assembly protein PilN